MNPDDLVNGDDDTRDHDDVAGDERLESNVSEPAPAPAAAEEHPAGFRSGFVALVGRPNVGKSTLLNQLTGELISIVTDVPQTTRFPVRGVRHLPGMQVVFIDTPGIHKPRHRLNEEMVRAATQVLREVDLVIVMVDASDGYGPGDRFVFDRVREAGSKALLVLNKADAMRKEDLLPLIDQAARLDLFQEIVPLSASTGDNCDRLMELITARLPEAPPPFPSEFVTDLSMRQRLSEAIRAEILHRTRQEVPHATAVQIEAISDEPALTRIEATILVERDSQKGIVIGEGGQRIKEIGSAARKRLEQLAGKQVHLALWVKVRPDWRDNEPLLRLLGLTP
ncbi:MAG TPA: GTPase Era [Candidatus Polarisedimenticolia bacterium]|jgi:GTP-binding protein Era|nr:GTPase Era [Candidatus Polarisedimenticolia bacterium]